MNRRTLLTAFLPGIIGFALPALAQSGKLRKFRVRIKTKSVVGTTIEARDQVRSGRQDQQAIPRLHDPQSQASMNLTDLAAKTRWA